MSKCAIGTWEMDVILLNLKARCKILILKHNLYFLKKHLAQYHTKKTQKLEEYLMLASMRTRIWSEETRKN